MDTMSRLTYVEMNIITSTVIFGKTNMSNQFLISVSKDVEREHAVEKSNVVIIKSYRNTYKISCQLRTYGRVGKNALSTVRPWVGGSTVHALGLGSTNLQNLSV